MRYIHLLVLSLLCLSTPLLAQTLAINSLSSMPLDTTTILINNDASIWPPSGGLVPLLQSQGIQVETYPAQIAWVAAYGFVAPDPTSPYAPFGDMQLFTAVRFTFPEPVYAFGGTFFATQFPTIDNPGTSFDNNVPDMVYQVVARDGVGNIVDVAFSSSYEERHGPGHFYVYLGSAPALQFMTSFAGIWSATPIHEITFFTPQMANSAKWGSLSYSRTPLASLPQVQSLEGVTKRITTSSADQVKPSISGTRLGYADVDNTTSNTYVYDLTSNTESLLSNLSENDQLGGIDGTRVVYTHSSANGTDVFVYDVVGATSTQLSFDETSHDPAISGEYMAWVTGPPQGPMNIMLADLANMRNSCALSDGTCEP